MRRRTGLASAFLAVITALAALPSLVSAQTPADLLRHDVENGCGSEESNVPDSSAWLAAVFGGPMAPLALPELVRWAADPDSRSYATTSCNVHDRCYGTLGAGKGDCDGAFLGDLTAACYDAYLTPEWDWWDWASLGTSFVVDTVWEAGAYAPCVYAGSTAMYAGVGVFGGEAYTQAQRDALAAAVCSPSHPQGTFGGLYLSTEGVRKAWDTGCGITDLAFGDGRWAGAGHLGAPSDQWLKGYSSPDAILPDWTALAAQGYQLTSLEYGDGEWAAVFTAGTGITGQENRNADSFSSLADGFQQAAADGYAVTEVEYGDGTWVMYASAGTTITQQTWEISVSNADLAATIRRHWDEGFSLTNVEYDDETEGWFLLFSKGMPWADSGYAFNGTYHETRVGMDNDAAAGRWLQDLEYGGGIWLAAWYLPSTTPPDTSTTEPPTTISATVSVPNLVGMTEEEARRTLDALGLTVTLGRSHLRLSTSPSDTALAAAVDHQVVFQDPPARTDVARGSNVQIQLLEWRVVVPDWVGALPSEVSAQAEAMRLNLNPSQVEMLPAGDPLVGRVAAVSPPPGTVVLPGSTVAVRIGVAAEAVMVDVPDVGGMYASDAQEAIEGVGLVFRIGGFAPAGLDMAGRVFDQDPPPYAAQVPLGSTVEVYLGSDLSNLIVFPERRTSNSVGVWIEGYDHGSFIGRGTTIDVCVYAGTSALPNPRWTLYDHYPIPYDYSGDPAATPREQIASGADQGPYCYPIDTRGPGGFEMFEVVLTFNPGEQVQQAGVADIWVYVP